MTELPNLARRRKISTGYGIPPRDTRPPCVQYFLSRMHFHIVRQRSPNFDMLTHRGEQFLRVDQSPSANNVIGPGTSPLGARYSSRIKHLTTNTTCWYCYFNCAWL